MSAQLMEGKPVAEAVLADVAARVAALREKGVVPGLGTILVGDDPASAGYVRKKHETCERVGIRSFDARIGPGASQADLLQAVVEFNRNPDVDAFLVQNPVPPGFDSNEAMLHMDPNKDGDGLHPFNLGKLVLQEAGPRPCTPSGILAMLKHYEIPVDGREVVIIGRGPTLGRPLALMLSLKQPGANAAVSVVHTGVPNIAAYTRRADILIAAVGVAGFVMPGMVKPGAVVISGGISWQGKKLLPDVDESVGEVAGWITARLGGVGPTTVALLLRNAVECAGRRSMRMY
jgi:methylenetetrahydrofolate dehydrogenase (NADP+)/methenyltetrahydrofolate cyclohydrolase